MTVKEFVGMQDGFSKKRVKFTVDGVPLTVSNFDTLANERVIAWGMYIDRVLELSTECGEGF